MPDSQPSGTVDTIHSPGAATSTKLVLWFEKSASAPVWVNAPTVN
ncbi:MAG: hypothetical protein R2878_11340 [Thermoleophilia bacterium]